MVNPCCCCGPAAGSRILAIVSFIIALAVVATSAIILRDTYEARESTARKAVSAIGNAADSVGSFLGVSNKINVDKRLNILLWTSATGVAVGGLQLLSSLLLLIGGAGKSAAPSGIYSFINSIGFLGLLGSLVCLFYTQIYTFDGLESLPDQDKAWLVSMTADIIFLLYGICASAAFMRA